ncbi:MAG: hypothetical protein ABI905_13955, partial [Betaproteobacteria bacterium]
MKSTSGSNVAHDIGSDNALRVFDRIRQFERDAREIRIHAPQFSRRYFLQSALSLAAMNIVAAWSPRVGAQAVNAARFTSYPFALGVASGAPRADSVVLW